MDCELLKIETPVPDWALMALFLFCRLETNFQGREPGLPYDSSYKSVQKLLGHVGYVILSPYHRWVSIFDIKSFCATKRLLHNASHLLSPSLRLRSHGSGRFAKKRNENCSLALGSIFE